MSNLSPNKEIQRKRMIIYFVNAVDEISQDEGKTALTARRVADKAGYNVATLYNYFSNFNHLLLFASIRCLNSYAEDLATKLKGVTDPIQKYLQVWECFSWHSYSNPEKYHEIFFGEFDVDTVNESIRLYYDVFPEVMTDEIKEFVPMLKSSNIFERDYLILQNISQKTGKITNDEVHEINEINCLLYQSLLYRHMNKTISETPEETVKKTLYYIKKILKSYGI